MQDLPGSAAGGRLQEDALSSRAFSSALLQVNAYCRGVRIGRWVGAGIDMRDLERAMSGLVAGHFARTERSVGRHHV